MQATVADNLLQQDFIRRPEYGSAIETLGVLVVGIIVSLLVARFGLAWGGATIAAYLAGRLGGRGGLLSGASVVFFAACIRRSA